MNEEVRKRSCAKRSPALFWARTLSLGMAFLFASLAAMQPHRLPSNGVSPPKFEEVDEIAFIVDVSASMGVADTSVKERRLDRAKEVINDVVENLGGVPISLSCFAGNLETVVPATLDWLSFRDVLAAVAIDDTLVLGTNFFALFESLEKNILQGSREKKVHCILFSDGEDTLGAKKEAVLEKVARFPKRGSRIDVVGLGSALGGTVPGLPVVSKLDRNFLESLAHAGGGTCFFEGEMNLPSLIEGLVSSSLFQREKTGQTKNGESLVAYPLVCALIFLLAFLFIPARFRTLSLFCCILSPSLYGGENFDQGMRAYNAHKYVEARVCFEKEAALSESPEVRACMLYNSGSAYLAEGLFSEAARSFGQIDSRYITSPLVKAAVVQNLAYALLQEARLARGASPETLFASLEALQATSDATLGARIKEETAIIQAMPSPKKYSSDAVRLFHIEQELIEILSKEPSTLYARAIVEEAGLKDLDFDKMDAIALLQALDRARFEKESDPRTGDEIESALILCLEAETMRTLSGKESLWNRLFEWRRALFDKRMSEKIAEGSSVATSLAHMGSSYSFKDLVHYYRSTKMSPDRLFRAVFEEQEEMARKALWEKIGEGNPPGVMSKMEIVALWSRHHASCALSYLLGFAESQPIPVNIAYVKEAWGQYRKSLHAKKIQFVDALFSELETCIDASCVKLFLRAIAMTLFFEDAAAQDSKKAVSSACEFEKMAASYTGAHPELLMSITEESFKALSGIILPKELGSEIDQFLSGAITQDGGSFLYNYYHDRARELLEKILRFLQKEVQKRKPPREEKGESTILSPDMAIRLSQEMERDDTMFQKSSKEHIGGDRPW